MCPLISLVDLDKHIASHSAALIIVQLCVHEFTASDDNQVERNTGINDCTIMSGALTCYFSKTLCMK